jgi:hypothetical protein
MTSKSKIEVYKVGCFPNYRYQNGANTYISAGLDPFTNGNKLSYSTLHFTDNVTMGKQPCCLVVTLNISNQATYSSQLLMEFIFLTLCRFLLQQMSLLPKRAPSVTNLQLVHSLDTLLCQEQLCYKLIAWPI